MEEWNLLIPSQQILYELAADIPCMKNHTKDHQEHFSRCLSEQGTVQTRGLWTSTQDLLHPAPQKPKIHVFIGTIFKARGDCLDANNEH